MNGPTVATIIGALIGAVASISVAIINAGFSQPQSLKKSDASKHSKGKVKSISDSLQRRSISWILILIIFTLAGGVVGFMIARAAQERTIPPTPTYVITETPTATSIPAMVANTITPSFINTITPTPIFLLPKQSSASKCNSDLADHLFKYAFTQSDKLASTLGRQMMDHPLCIPSSYQPFEGGEMIWRSDDPNIYVLFATHEWMPYKNNYRIGNPEVPCNKESLPNDRLQPLLGFGKIWCDNQSVREKLGYATIGESANDRAILTFENGWLILINYTVHAIFYEKGQWESAGVFNSTQVSLESRSDLDKKESNLGLGKGSILLPQAPLTIFDPLSGKPLSVLFDAGWKVSTQCADTPEHPTNIQIATNISHPIRVYLLLQAGWGVKSYEYRTIGKVSLKFDSGEPIETPLILGYNIRDWAERSIAITTLVSPYAQAAWEGFDEVPGKIDILILDIPESYYSSSVLKEIQIEDDSILATGEMNPCIHLSAITVSYLP